MSDGPDPALVAALSEAIECRLAAQRLEPLVVGICGAQGSGKTTLAGAVAKGLRSRGAATAVLSLDDLYLAFPARTTWRWA